jgi:hypothetical protein
MLSHVIPQAVIAEVAATQVGVREKSRNMAPELQKYWDATTYKAGMRNREPWCAAFVSWCVQEADRRMDALSFPVPPRFSAVADYLPWAAREDVGALTFSPRDQVYRPQAGDLAVFIFSHIGIVESYGGRLSVVTVEGNTGPDGGRDGDGCYRKCRAFSIIKRFIRLPVLPQRVIL